MGYAAITRDYFPGMGQAVADRTINRKIMSSTDGETRVETWGEVAARVSYGNALLEPRVGARSVERARMHHHLRQASVLMSGRHLQHGDETQPSRPIEVFTNCSTSATSFLLFYLLLNGSGVGRAYDDRMMAVDWRFMPTVICTIDPGHKDVASGEIRNFMSLRDAEHMHAFSRRTVFRVPDSREGWAKAIEMMEQMAYERRADEVLLLDFTDVRPRGAPIHGMQKRPASGPGPLMQAISNIARIRDSDMEPWRQTMFVDHYLAECVLVGGARRAARMATKTWRDANVLDFIKVKRGGFLWSSNNSVTIDAEFRERVLRTHKRVIPYPREQVRERLDFLMEKGVIDEVDAHAYWVLQQIAEASYFDGTGEPGIINQDRLTQNDVGMNAFDDGHYAESERFKVFDETLPLMKRLVEIVRGAKYRMITNPCGEVALNMLGGYCVIADVVPFHAQDDDDAEDAFRTATRALIRTNLMDSLYARETKRTNRIGVGITGFHEWAYSRFKFGWKQIVDEKTSLEMWLMLSRFKRAIVQEARRYSRELGVVEPHTNTTFKPAGCRPWNALTTTTKGLLTLQELFADHEDGATWSDVVSDVRAIQGAETKPLTKTFVNGKAEVFEVRLAYGLTVESTGNHPWFVKGRHVKGEVIPVNAFVRTDELQPGDVLDVAVGVYEVEDHAPLVPLKTTALRMRGAANPISQPTHMNPDLAWLLGYLWGDGAMSPTKYRLRWLDRNMDNLVKANRILEEQFGVSGSIFKDPKKDAHSLEIANVELWHWLIKNGVFKYHADEIDLIPQRVRGSAQEDIIAFIAGLIDADGAIVRHTDKSVTLATAQASFARHVQDVGWAVGVAFGNSHNTVGENWQKGRKSMWLLTMSAASTKKAVSMLVRHSNKMAAADAESREWRHDRPGRPLRRIIGKVESVTSVGEKDTFDVEVADNHWFYAGAVKSHNTTSKLFGLTEGAHLPSMREFIRWVQFRYDDPLVEDYKRRGYPTRELKSYSGTVIVGFPTRPAICELDGGDWVTTAAEATPQEQYEFLRLLEKYWIRGVEEDGVTPLPETGNQVSYTLKYDPKKVSFEKFHQTLIEGQFSIRCCSVMPQIDATAYEYQPEEPVSKARFLEVLAGIRTEGVHEDIGFEHVDCGAGGCPIDWSEGEKAA